MNGARDHYFPNTEPLAANEMVFGAALDPGEAPLSGVQVGAAVDLLDVPKPAPAATERSAASTEASVIGSGTVGTGCFLELNGSKITDNQWLKPGDEVVMEVDQLGRLVNTIEAAE